MWVYYTIPFGFNLFWHFLASLCNFWSYYVWLRITDEGSIPEMRIWSILLITSVLKWCMYLSKSRFLNLRWCIISIAAKINTKFKVPSRCMIVYFTDIFPNNVVLIEEKSCIIFILILANTYYSSSLFWIPEIITCHTTAPFSFCLFYLYSEH